MENGQHYFNDHIKTKVKFVGEELWGMEEYYAAMVPEIGLPLQGYNHCCQKEDYLEVYT